MLDIDHFKAINDRHGHAVGDQVLTAVAERLHRGVRGPDTVARFGGVEFGVLLPEAGADEACIVTERLLATIRTLEVPGAPGLAVRASAGVAAPLAGAPCPEDAEALMTAADRALYEAKRSGRDRYCVEVVEAVPTPAPR